jgi:glycosyltransferase involved in cell wall biosynthesis
LTPLKVLYLIDSLSSGGAQRQLVALLSTFDRAIVSPEVAIYHPLYHFREDLDRLNVPLHMLGPASGRNPKVALNLIRLLRRGSFELIHSYLRTPGVLARVASFFSPGVRVVVSERNEGLWRYPWRLALERALSGRADALIVNSHAMADEMLELVPAWKGRMYVVPNGIVWTDLTEEERKAAAAFRARFGDSADVLLLVIGRLSRQKAPDVLIEALSRLPAETLTRIRVVWVGSREDERLARLVESRVAAGHLSERVRFLPPTRDTRSMYVGADALVLPSRWEGLPNVVLEALAHGTPVIATDVGDTGRILRGAGAGWLVPPEDPDSMARAIGEFVSTTEERRAEMGKAGSESVLRDYSASRLLERTLKVYEEVLPEQWKRLSAG